MTPEELARERRASLERRAKARAAEAPHVRKPAEPMGHIPIPSRKMREKLRENEFVPPPSVLQGGTEV